MRAIDPEEVLMSWWVTVVVLVGVAGVIAALLASSRRRPTAEVAEPAPERIAITLEIEAEDVEDPRVKRLVADAASRMFRMVPSLRQVEVRDKRGKVLDRPMRSGGDPLRVDPPPVGLVEPHTVRRPRSPSESGERLGDVAAMRSAATGALAGGWLRDVPEPEPRVLADRFDLADEIRERITDPDDAVALIAAILERSADGVRIEGGRLWVGDAIVFVIRTPPGASVTAGALARTFASFRASGASLGYVVVFGHMDPIDVRRRELLAPGFVHLGSDAVQRMADAAALGGDPLRSARGPAIAEQLAHPAGRPFPDDRRR